MNQSQDITELSRAMLQVQQSIRPAMKDATNPFTRSNYATLNSVMESCRDALLSQGILFTQLPCPAPVELGAGHIGLETRLIHAESGQWISSMAVIPLPKNDPQGMGSAITYARCYSLCAMLGIVTEDDDGESAKISPQTAMTQRRGAGSPQRQKEPSDNSTPANKNSGALKRVTGDSKNLPKLDGVTYHTVQTQDGRPCIIARGETASKKTLLMAAGFTWNQQQRLWWKYADIA